jgi:hypothetical protein
MCVSLLYDYVFCLVFVIYSTVYFYMWNTQMRVESIDRAYGSFSFNLYHEYREWVGKCVELLQTLNMVWYPEQIVLAVLVRGLCDSVNAGCMVVWLYVIVYPSAGPSMGRCVSSQSSPVIAVVVLIFPINPSAFSRRPRRVRPERHSTLTESSSSITSSIGPVSPPTIKTWTLGSCADQERWLHFQHQHSITNRSPSWLATTTLQSVEPPFFEPSWLLRWQIAAPARPFCRAPSSRQTQLSWGMCTLKIANTVQIQRPTMRAVGSNASWL